MNQLDSCLGNNLTLEEVEEYWNNNDCITILTNSINENETYSYNSENQQYIANGMNTLLQNYTSQFDLTTENEFIRKIYNACVSPSLPGICNIFLESYCNNFSRQEVAANKQLNNFCGCFVPPDNIFMQYIQGTTGCIDGSSPCTFCTGTSNFALVKEKKKNKQRKELNSISDEDKKEKNYKQRKELNYDLNEEENIIFLNNNSGCTGIPSCDPLCRKTTVVQRANVNNGNLITCNLNLCAIDGNNITITSGSTSENLLFTNICNNCSQSNPCLCVINTNNLANLSVASGVGVELNNYCSKNSICIINGEEKPCEIEPSQVQTLFLFKIIWGVVSLMVFLLVIVIILIFYYRKFRLK